ncbi:putative ATP-grasp-modified RiPP [Streptomyces sp. NPDC005970]|uniref:putative ATP-grasp-modified RiPP n=1 Tax=Streptomyces sp. NPDC005970 TaxID=3156723 RepID=UPI0033E31421
MSQHTATPWGLTRMEPYRSVIEVTGMAIALDPETQTTVYEDTKGHRLDMGKHGTGTGQETKTRTSRGDGNGPSNADEGHDQESDKD